MPALNLPLSLNDWTYNTILELVNASEVEPGEFDYKEVLNATDPNKGNEHNASIRRTACSMANTDGGHIIFGVRDQRQRVAQPMDRIVGITRGGDYSRDFANKMAGIQPVIQFETSPTWIALPTDETKGLFVARIPRSASRPHMVRELGVFYRRDNGGNSTPMDYYQVRELMLRQRDALLANLRWELEDNIMALCPHLEGLPSPAHRWLDSTRRAITLAPHDTTGVISLTYQQAMRLSVFWLSSPDGARLKDSALQGAIHSGEFFILQEGSSNLVGGELYGAMRALAEALDSYQRAYRILGSFSLQLSEIGQAVRSKWPSIEIAGDLLVFLYSLQDRQQDILRLATALLRHIHDPSAELQMPQLNPISPLEGETERILSHVATREDIAEWLNYPYLSDMITGEQKASESDILAATERYPKLDELIGRPLQEQIAPHVEEFMARLQSDGMDEAMSWLQCVLLQQG